MTCLVMDFIHQLCCISLAARRSKIEIDRQTPRLTIQFTPKVPPKPLEALDSHCERFSARHARLSADEKWFFHKLMRARSIDYSTNSSMNDSFFLFGFISNSPVSISRWICLYFVVDFSGGIFGLSIRLSLAFESHRLLFRCSALLPIRFEQF